MNLAIWTLLFLIVVYDLREQKIPNKLIVLLALIVFLSLLSNEGFGTEQALSSIGGAAFALAIGLVLYGLGVFAAGDVKLIAVLSMWLGYSNVGNFYISSVFCGGVISIFFLLERLSQSNTTFRESINSYITSNVYGRIQRSKTVNPIVIKVPFAPAIVSGLIVLPYFS
ncbi:A24 family peptidase [Vibrio sp. 10N]|uniref:A24 family peptidase n=1 Tax=Vibrio sp. 10N TaxID=3058938 RepID=UPI002813BB37|nr:A24 family peptidase [Vibrio sp. 10N]